jgi:hypothetical protein
MRSKDLLVGTWNVLSLYRDKLLLEQLDKYKAGIIALQEICWTGVGILGKKDWTIFYSGHKSQHILSTGFAI